AVPVLLVEQNLAVVRRLARHCVVLADGRTAHRGPAADLLADAAAARRLLGVGSAAKGSADQSVRTAARPAARTTEADF
ncbi:ABC transporter ATP-binding protein, partial [Streptomyces broussonetiae]